MVEFHLVAPGGEMVLAVTGLDVGVGCGFSFSVAYGGALGMPLSGRADVLAFLQACVDEGDAAGAAVAADAAARLSQPSATPVSAFMPPAALHFATAAVSAEQLALFRAFAAELCDSATADSRVLHILSALSAGEPPTLELLEACAMGRIVAALRQQTGRPMVAAAAGVLVGQWRAHAAAVLTALQQGAV